MTSAKFDAWSRAPKPVLCDNLQGQGGEGGSSRVQDGGTRVHPWLTHVNVWQKPSQYGKVIILQLK